MRTIDTMVGDFFSKGGRPIRSQKQFRQIVGFESTPSCVDQEELGLSCVDNEEGRMTDSNELNNINGDEGNEEERLTEIDESDMNNMDEVLNEIFNNNDIDSDNNITTIITTENSNNNNIISPPKTTTTDNSNNKNNIEEANNNYNNDTINNNHDDNNNIATITTTDNSNSNKNLEEANNNNNNITTDNSHNNINIEEANIHINQANNSDTNNNIMNTNNDNNNNIEDIADIILEGELDEDMCVPKCDNILYCSDSKYAHEGQLLHGSRCKIEINIQYLRQGTAWHCKYFGYDDHNDNDDEVKSCNYIECDKCRTGRQTFNGKRRRLRSLAI
jgi:hypothetical protein